MPLRHASKRPSLLDRKIQTATLSARLLWFFASRHKHAVGARMLIDITGVTDRRVRHVRALLQLSVVSIVFLAMGFVVFRWLERDFADYL